MDGDGPESAVAGKRDFSPCCRYSCCTNRSPQGGNMHKAVPVGKTSGQINDDSSLEREADVMGAKAATVQATDRRKKK